MGVRRRFLLILISMAFATMAFAQGLPQQTVISVPDGGANGRMESLFIPPKAGAPFSFILVTEWSRPLGNGGTFTLTNERRIVRDSNGRIYQERWLLVPKNGSIKSYMDIFQITDPEQHTWLNCATANKVCELRPYPFTTQQKFQANPVHWPTAMASTSIWTSALAASRAKRPTATAKSPPSIPASWATTGPWSPRGSSGTPRAWR